MEESTIQILGLTMRGDFFLVLVLLVSVVLILMILIFKSSSSKREMDEETSGLEALLSKPEILELIKTEKTTITELLELTRKDVQAKHLSITSILEKISRDIEWDVSGIIGVAVTIVLLFMVVSGTIEKVPEQIYTGWLLILGYYFGKGSKNR